LSGIIFNFSSCRKETDCKATIRCIDSVGNSVGSVDVLLYAPVKSPDGKTTYTGDVTANGTTDGSGEVRFTFKLPAIYDIKATLATGTRTYNGVGIIKLEEGKSVDKTVTMK
jgi:hypothetical protein